MDESDTKTLQLQLFSRVVWSITVLFVWVLCAHDGASAEHHLVLRQSASLVWEDVFDLPQVLRDVQGLALDAAVGLFIVQIHVISDEEDLADLHQLNGDVEGNGNQDLNRGKMVMPTNRWGGGRQI